MQSSSGSSLGSSIQSSEIDDGAVSPTKLSALARGIDFLYSESITASTFASITTEIDNDTYDYYLLFYSVVWATSGHEWGIQLNGVTSATYDAKKMNGTSVNAVTNSTAVTLGDTNLQANGIGIVIIDSVARGSRLGVANGGLGATYWNAVGALQTASALSQIDVVDINIGNATGIIQLFGVRSR